MASLESLPPDQRAVLDLVLKRGRSYDEIAQMLGIDRAAVRERALAAFDELGPQTRIPPERRALITDYLLGQLPARVADATRERLGQSAGERAWARVLASEVAPTARQPLPEIPIEATADHDRSASAGIPVAGPAPHGAALAGPGLAAAAEPAGGAQATPASEPARRRPTSRLGGAILLGAGALVVLAVALIILLTGGGSKKSPAAHASTSTAASTSPSSAAAGSTSTTSTNNAHVVAQINLLPTISGSKAAGVVFVVKQGTNTGIAIQAQHIPPNGKRDAYAVWLYNSPSDSLRLGFVTPAVGTSGVLQAETVLPPNAARFKQILVTDETTSQPRAPGKQVLRGTLAGLS
ncbi:MAG: hypothetical protein JOZ98_17050 [Solirubrobacterales bacterium]|nr:hypothetical protein [Solirubrobacterales bacterium]